MDTQRLKRQMLLGFQAGIERFESVVKICLPVAGSGTGSVTRSGRPSGGPYRSIRKINIPSTLGLYYERDGNVLLQVKIAVPSGPRLPN